MMEVAGDTELEGDGLCKDFLEENVEKIFN